MLPAKNPWWKEYRQNQYKPRETLSIEMIVRKSFIEVLREYTENCCIAGIPQICDPKSSWKLRIARICLFCSMVILLWKFLNTWYGTLANPLIVNTESSTYPISEIDFPAVALCNVNRISKKTLKAMVNEVYSHLSYGNETVNEAEEFFTQIGRLLDFSYNEQWGKGNTYLDKQAALTIDSRGFLDVMKTLAPSCSEMLVRCMWAGELVECASLFTVRRTVRGHCCAFNYVLDYDSAKSPNHTLGLAKRQRLPGLLHGLTVVLDPLLDDYAYPLNHFMGFDVFLFDPTHFADLSAGRVIHRLVEANKAEILELKSIKQVASPEVRKYPITIRKCLFKDEMKNEFNNMYSYSACIVSCRIKSIQSLCKCTPYFLPAGKAEGSICTMDDLKCLNKYKEKLLYLYPINAEKFEGLEVELEDSLYCPECLPDCELTQHFTKSYKRNILLLGQKPYRIDEYLEDINMTNKCLLSIYHAVSDGILDRLDVVAYWFEVISNIGGFGGVLFGLSIFSVVEIVYFLLIRFMIKIRCNYIKYQ